jgi:hypothetical protein
MPRAYGNEERSLTQSEKHGNEERSFEVEALKLEA